MICTVIILVVCICSTGYALNNGLALTPPMGWLHWERFRCNTDCVNDPDFCVREQLIMQMADRMVSDGYKDLGYEYVNIDDCWLARERDAQGRLQADPDRFPSGMSGLAKYIHSKGLKLGIYEDFGTETCAKYPGSEFYLSVDAQTFADWGIDYVKFDVCNSDSGDSNFGFPIMGFFLNQTGRPMIFSCEWPLVSAKPNFTAVRDTCNLWRTSHDMEDSWEMLSYVIEFYGNDTNGLSAYAGPGGWNDPDELIIGNFGLSYEQERVQMAMWAIFAAPLLMSVDLRDIRPASKALLQNKNVLRINQDPMGIQGKRRTIVSNIEVWTRPISPEGTVAVALLNVVGKGMPTRVTVSAKQMGLSNTNGYNLTEVFDGQPIGTLTPQESYTVKVNPSGVYFFTANPL
ncbi:alpha-N-acetylgalactosaminidase-like [Liolophura sinensis]|uniref:alpha-N-acetylgalactosaminidase-like n=1 Tax=Liolophura sinensis TaxID=3198878 RepID=UPI0031592B1E